MRRAFFMNSRTLVDASSPNLAHISLWAAFIFFGSHEKENAFQPDLPLADLQEPNPIREIGKVELEAFLLRALRTDVSSVKGDLGVGIQDGIGPEADPESGGGKPLPMKPVPPKMITLSMATSNGCACSQIKRFLRGG
jgi:hypothetical protein